MQLTAQNGQSLFDRCPIQDNIGSLNGFFQIPVWHTYNYRILDKLPFDTDKDKNVAIERGIWTI